MKQKRCIIVTKAVLISLTALVVAIEGPHLNIAQAAETKDNPCQDSIYLELKEKKLDVMTDREYEIFKQKDAACSSYKESARTLSEVRGGKTGKALEATSNVVWIVLGVVTLLGLIAML